MIRDEKGQSLVEMALVVPLLLLLVVGIFDIGRMLYSYSSLHFTAQETVRLGGLGKSDIEIESFAKDKFTAGDSSRVTVQITPTQNLRTSGDYVKVTLNYPIDSLIPLVSTLLPEHIMLSADSTIRVE